MWQFIVSFMGQKHEKFGCGSIVNTPWGRGMVTGGALNVRLFKPCPKDPTGTNHGVSVNINDIK